VIYGLINFLLELSFFMSKFWMRQKNILLCSRQMPERSSSIIQCFNSLS